MRSNRKWVTLALAALVAPALVPTAPAAHSDPCPPWTQYVPEDSEESTYPVYVAIDELFTGGWSIWIYGETNGQRGLQRDDDYCYNTHPDGTPVTADARDAIIF